jgi:cold shock CspA family protein
MSSDRKIGNVKWFNNKAGFGFITMGENTDSPKDVFAHYSNIKVSNSQYKYLVQGEYVEFDLSPTTDGEHEVQATNITGIQGGATLCERRRISREAAAASELRGDGDVQVREESARVRRPPAARRPRPEGDEEEGFTTVRKKRPAPKSARI